MLLSDSVVKSMAVGKVFKDGADAASVTCADYYHNGKYLVTSSDDNSVRLYDAVSGTRKTILNAFKYGVDVLRFTHHDYSVVCASNNGWDHTLRYWSLHDNSYLRYFRGHSDRVDALAMSPVNDCFLSGSVDGSVRMWDLRTNVCQGLLKRRAGGRAAVAFDPQGLIFATTSQHQIKLFDSRSFDKGPFSTFQVTYDVPFEFGSMKFSNDGHSLLLSTSCDAVFLLDAFDGDMKQIYTHRKNPQKRFFEASFTPDSRYVLSGGEDGSVHVWAADSGAETARLKGHAGPVKSAIWNPAYLSMASACENLCLWVPNM